MGFSGVQEGCAAVSKTVEHASVPRVRIPYSPPLQPMGRLGCSRIRRYRIAPLNSIPWEFWVVTSWPEDSLSVRFPLVPAPSPQFEPLAGTTPLGPIAPELVPSDRAARPVTPADSASELHHQMGLNLLDSANEVSEEHS